MLYHQENITTFFYFIYCSDRWYRNEISYHYNVKWHLPYICNRNVFIVHIFRSFEPRVNINWSFRLVLCNPVMIHYDSNNRSYKNWYQSTIIFWHVQNHSFTGTGFVFFDCPYLSFPIFFYQLLALYHKVHITCISQCSWTVTLRKKNFYTQNQSQRVNCTLIFNNFEMFRMKIFELKPQTGGVNA